MRLTRRETYLLGITVIIIGTAFYYLYFYMPLMNDIDGIKTRISSQKVKLDEVQDYAGQLDNLRQEINGLKNTLVHQCKNIPKRFDQPTILVFLEETIDPLALKLGLSFGEIENHEKYGIAKVKISIYTTYNNLKELLGMFETAPYPNKLERLAFSVSESSDKGKKYNVKAEIILGFYYLNSIPEDETT